MKIKKGLLFLSLVAFGLVGCDSNNQNIDSNEDPIDPDSVDESTILSNYLNDNFSDVDNLNYTQLRVNGYKSWPVDQETYEIVGDVTVIDYYGTTTYVDGGVRRYGEENASSSSYSINTDTGFDYYSYDSSTMSYTLNSAYSESGMKWSDRFSSAYDLIGYYEDYLTNESETVAYTTDEEAIAIFASLIGYTTITYDNYYASLSYEDDTLRLEVMYADGLYITEYNEEEETYIYAYQQYYIAAIFTDVGTTSIDTSVLGI